RTRVRPTMRLPLLRETHAPAFYPAYHQREPRGSLQLHVPPRGDLAEHGVPELMFCLTGRNRQAVSRHPVHRCQDRFLEIRASISGDDLRRPSTIEADDLEQMRMP